MILESESGKVNKNMLLESESGKTFSKFIGYIYLHLCHPKSKEPKLLLIVYWLKDFSMYIVI